MLFPLKKNKDKLSMKIHGVVEIDGEDYIIVGCSSGYSNSVKWCGIELERKIDWIAKNEIR